MALATPADVLDKTAYVLANPAAAGLVRHGRDWPGLWSAPEQIGGAPLVARRPGDFFRANGVMPEEVELGLTVPPGFDSAEAFRDQLVAALEVREEQAEKDASVKRLGFLGRTKVLSQKTTTRPLPFEPRQNLNPRVAARDKWKRIEVLATLSEFLADYRQAWSARRAGQLDAIFPHGTYLMRVLHGAPCALA